MSAPKDVLRSKPFGGLEMLLFVYPRSSWLPGVDDSMAQSESIHAKCETLGSSLSSLTHSLTHLGRKLGVD
jgi:hypothetical protein